jgi:hypothetical protein
VGVKVQYIHRAMVGANCPQDGVYNGVVPAEDQRPAMVVEYRGDCFFNGHETASSPIGHEIARILETRVAIKADAQQRNARIRINSGQLLHIMRVTS